MSQSSRGLFVDCHENICHKIIWVIDHVYGWGAVDVHKHGKKEWGQSIPFHPDWTSLIHSLHRQIEARNESPPNNCFQVLSRLRSGVNSTQLSWELHAASLCASLSSGLKADKSHAAIICNTFFALAFCCCTIKLLFFSYSICCTF